MNVHPTKAEVRFRDQSFVHEIVKHAIADAIGGGRPPELELAAPFLRQPEPASPILPGTLGAGVYPSRWSTQAAGSAANTESQIDGGALAVAAGTRVAETGAALADAPMKRMMPLGQFRDTFIIAVDTDGIAIIDQHVAHERVLFERVMEQLTAGRLESQRLLVPMLVELSPEGRQALLSHGADLDRL